MQRKEARSDAGVAAIPPFPGSPRPNSARPSGRWAVAGTALAATLSAVVSSPPPTNSPPPPPPAKTLVTSRRPLLFCYRRVVGTAGVFGRRFSCTRFGKIACVEREYRLKMLTWQV